MHCNNDAASRLIDLSLSSEPADRAEYDREVWRLHEHDPNGFRSFVGYVRDELAKAREEEEGPPSTPDGYLRPLEELEGIILAAARARRLAPLAS